MISFRAVCGESAFAGEQREGAMPKGYWLVHVTIHDPEGYKGYIAANAAAFARYNGRFLARGGQNETHGPGVSPTQRHVLIEFDSYAQAKACYHSPEYTAALKIRGEAATASVVILEGWAG
jgi:uncharacterized protein (DUF1330 family)